jgi:hypothetical protein
VTNRSGERHVRQLEACRDTAQHQAAAAHVATSDEVHGKHQSLAEDWHQQIDILARCNAAKEHDFAVRTDGFPQRPRGLFERSSVGLVPQIDVAEREGTKRIDGDWRIGRPQSGVRRDDEHTACGDRIGWIRRTRESTCIRELAAKVQAADKAEDLSERRAGGALQLPGKVETCVRRQHHLSAETAAIGRRQQEHT